MTNTHTPGPWAVRAGDRGQKTVIVPHVDGYSVIAERVDSAAAPIIAAAPDLLVAGQHILQVAWNGTYAEQESALQSLRAAIAKAEGR